MKVCCVRDTPDEFDLTNFHKEYYRTQFGRGAERRYKSVRPGSFYVVYVVTINSGGYASFFVKHETWPSTWEYVPAPCFEVIDGRVSRYWDFHQSWKIVGSEPRCRCELAIREWVEQPSFFVNLIDRKPEAIDVFSRAARLMDAEF